MNVFFRSALAAVGFALASFAATAADRPLGERAFERLDANHDGKVDAAEMEAARTGQFKRLDANNDGVISDIEQTRATDRIRRRAAMREARLARQLEQMDADHDNAISEDEYVGAAPLSRADANKDGAVSREEFEATIASLQARRPRRN
jgi:Ca2+-binding EF-hand superfamily protein